MLSGEHLLIQDQNSQLFETVLKSSGHDSLVFVPENPVSVLQASASRFKNFASPPQGKSTGLDSAKYNLAWCNPAGIFLRILFAKLFSFFTAETST
jgi:hypothetical protein